MTVATLFSLDNAIKIEDLNKKYYFSNNAVVAHKGNNTIEPCSVSLASECDIEAETQKLKYLLVLEIHTEEKVVLVEFSNNGLRVYNHNYNLQFAKNYYKFGLESIFQEKGLDLDLSITELSRLYIDPTMKELAQGGILNLLFSSSKPNSLNTFETTSDKNETIYIPNYSSITKEIK